MLLGGFKKEKTNSRFRENESGMMTIIELLTVTALIMITSGVVFNSMRNSRSDLALERSAHLVARTLEEASNNALGGKPVAASSAAPPANSPPPGFGVSFSEAVAERARMTVFQDCDRDSRYDTSGSCVGTPGGTELINRIPFESGVSIHWLIWCGSDVYPNRTAARSPSDLRSINRIDIVYRSPGPEAWFAHYYNAPAITSNTSCLSNTNHTSWIESSPIVKSGKESQECLGPPDINTGVCENVARVTLRNQFGKFSDITVDRVGIVSFGI